MMGLIVFVTGAPGTGKSYTAKQFADEYNLRLFSYDKVKEEFWDLYGFKNRVEKDSLCINALEEFYLRLQKAMEHGINIITDYPWYQYHRLKLKQLVDCYNYKAITVCLYGDKKVIYDRHLNRNADNNRHLGHLTDCYNKDKIFKIKRITLNQKEFWDSLKDKNYNICIGKDYLIDFSDFNNIDLMPIKKDISEHLKGVKMNKLLEMHKKFPQTDLWTDSFAIEDHHYGLQQGSLGITTSPTWVAKMMINESRDYHKKMISKLHQQYPEYNEMELTWAWTLEMAKIRSQIMLPLWEQGNPKNGRFCVQSSIYEYNNYERILQMAHEVHACGPNLQIKIPCTENGIKAIEQATYDGISCMGTQCFAVDQAIAVCEAIERALKRRRKEGLDNSRLNPMVALLPGMIDDSIKANAENNKLVIHPDALNWAGVATAKKIIKMIGERNYSTRPLIAYYRSQLHWSEFIGADVAMTIPVKWQKRFVDCAVEIKNYYDVPVEEWKINELLKNPLFVQVYSEGVMEPSDFVKCECVVNTFKYFMSEYQKAVEIVRETMLSE